MRAWSNAKIAKSTCVESAWPLRLQLLAIGGAGGERKRQKWGLLERETGAALNGERESVW